MGLEFRDPCGNHSPSEEVESMDTDQDITIGINLQQVSIHGVKHEAPKNERR